MSDQEVQPKYTLGCNPSETLVSLQFDRLVFCGRRDFFCRTSTPAGTHPLLIKLPRTGSCWVRLHRTRPRRRNGSGRWGFREVLGDQLDRLGDSRAGQ